MLAQHVDEEVVAAGDPLDQPQDGGCHALPAAAIHAAGDAKAMRIRLGRCHVTSASPASGAAR